jgi:hypothetical protein
MKGKNTAPTERHPPLNAALPVTPDSLRFSFASHGMTAAAATRNGAATRPLGEIACREKRAERRGASAVPVLGDLQGAAVRIDSASVFTCLRIALRISPENGPTRLQ